MGLKVLTLVVYLIVMLGAPVAAEASIYIWKNVDGSWTDPNNWTPADGGTTYPNAPGDQALFSATYTAFRTVTIPDGAVVTVGAIFFTDRAMTITSAGSGRLRLDNGAFAPQITRSGLPAGIGDVIGAPVELRGSVVINVSDAAAHILFSGEIGNAGCVCGIRKISPGKLFLRGDNSYVGVTKVEGGQLILDQLDTRVIKGDLEIGTGTPGPGTLAEVLIARDDQIFDNSRVLVTHQGQLTVDAAESVGETTIVDGTIRIRTGSGLFAPKGLNMTGGIIDSLTNGTLRLDGDVTAIGSGNGNGPARIIRSSGLGALDLGPEGDRFTINDRPNLEPDMTIELPIIAGGNVGLVKTGPGTLRFRGGNTYPGTTQVLAGKLRMEPPAGARSIVGALSIGSGQSLAIADAVGVDALPDNRTVLVGQTGVLWINTTAPETIGPLTVTKGGAVMVGNLSAVSVRLITPSLSMEGGSVQMFFGMNILEVTGALNATSKDQETAEITDGQLVLGGARIIQVIDRPAAIDLRITSRITGGAADGLVKTAEGVALLSGNNTYGGATQVANGTLLINGSQSTSPITLAGGTLGGSGRTGAITAGGGRVAPGESPGRLRSGSVAFTPTTEFEVELNGTEAGMFDQLAVTGTVNLGGATLQIVRPNGTPVPRDATWTIVDNDGVDPVVGTFDDMPEGYQFSPQLRITYRGGDGNDVVIEDVGPPTYFLAEGATGQFFDDDVLIANPNGVEAPVVMTFLREGGATVVVPRTIPARSRVTVRVEEIEGLESVSASVKVESTNYLPLIVERTMFWDASYYGGHTANAVAQPEKQWTFAEGFQGFFDTYLLIANANAAPVTATLTFLRENDTPVSKTVDVAAFQRKTVYAGDFDELKGRAFGIVVDATAPVIAERAMYFATQPGRLWAGGHVNTGIVTPSRSWFHAEGATGSYFSTFILLSNPQTTEAKVDVKFLLADGTVIERPKTLAPQQRVTINPAAEGDPRLENAALSTVVQSDVPIVSERSMYWEGDVPRGLGEGHNSSGVTETGLRWGLAEGRIGGNRVFDTYILLANPGTTTSKVRVTFLREGGAPIEKLYDVPATSRFNIDVKTEVPELVDTSFGADIEVMNDVPIAVERSLYWNANGAFWAGGTNALATPLPQQK